MRLSFPWMDLSLTVYWWHWPLFFFVVLVLFLFFLIDEGDL